MEVPGGHENKGKVLIYEMFGTAILTYAAIVSGGNAMAVGLTITVIIMCTGSITGAHYNPAVTTAVLFWKREFGKNCGFYFMILAAQFIGALLGAGFSWLVMMPTYLADYKVFPDAWLSVLCPTGVDKDGDTLSCDITKTRDRSAAVFQFFGTFIFVGNILLIKGKYSSPTNDNFLKALSVGLALAGQIFMSTN